MVPSALPMALRKIVVFKFVIMSECVRIVFGESAKSGGLGYQVMLTRQQNGTTTIPLHRTGVLMVVVQWSTRIGIESNRSKRSKRPKLVESGRRRQMGFRE